MKIIVNDIEKYFSVKMGKGNSVHQENPMNRSVFPMEIPALNCLSEVVIFCSNPQTNGRKNKRKGLKSFLMSIRTFKWLMDYHIR